MPDYFDTTYAGAFKAGNSLGEGLNSAAGSVAKQMELNKNRKTAYDTLKAAGMITEKTDNPSMDDLTKGLQDFGKQTGREVNVNYGDNPEEARRNITGIYKALNIPMPQGKTTTTLNLTPGTKYDPMKGDVSMEGVNPLDSLIKMENYKYMKNVNSQMDPGSGGGGVASLVYRDPVTGEEIPRDIAVQNMKDGKGRYVVNQKVITKEGIKENPVVKPEDMTKEEKEYLITANRVKTSLGDLKDNIYPNLDKIGGNKDWEAFQAQNVPFAGIRNQGIQDFKSSLTRLKADIPFLRGGKQLTDTEAKRVDILLNPFGKTKETREKDIERFQKEFSMGENLMKYGMAPSMGGSQGQSAQTPGSSFASEQEAAAANLAPGTKITINGRPAVWE